MIQGGIMYNYLRPKQKQGYLPRLIELQGGFRCFYCHEELGTDDRVWIYEHLDDDRQHNDIENIRIAHQSCNVAKQNNIEYRLMAQKELEIVSEKCLRERKCEDKEGKEGYSSEIAIHIQGTNYSKQFITEHITTDGDIDYTDALWAIVNDLNEKYGHGSEQAVRRYLNALCSITGKFMIIRNDKGRRVIVRREN